MQNISHNIITFYLVIKIFDISDTLIGACAVHINFDASYYEIFFFEIAVNSNYV